MDVSEFVATLQRHGIDTASFVPLAEGAQEEMYRLTVSGDQAVSNWLLLREMVGETGFWPIILGGDKTLEILPGLADENEGTHKDIIDAGLQLDAVVWMQETVAQNPQRFMSPTGTWPENVSPNHNFIIPIDLSTGQPHPSVYLGLLPTKASWQAPAFLRFGGWNDCPFDPVHVCMMKRWGELYGAEVVGISYDTVEMLSTRPPRDRSSALVLAREQYVYCSDIVNQGTETLEGLAAGLLHGTVWYFWWD